MWNLKKKKKGTDDLIYTAEIDRDRCKNKQIDTKEERMGWDTKVG